MVVALPRLGGDQGRKGFGAIAKRGEPSDDPFLDAGENLWKDERVSEQARPESFLDHARFYGRPAKWAMANLAEAS